MMKNTAVAAFALLASTVLADYGYSATGIGSANVINNCNYPVKLCNVPSSGGGGTEEDTSLEPGASWSQKWTSLTNGNGWSIKLSKTDNLNHILQYEYTFHNDGIIWYDLSCVDGNPWDGDWEVTANGTTCKPKQQAYRYSTDDAYGMQSCSQDSVITVTLCTGTSVDNGEALNGGSSSATSSSAPAYSAPAASSPSSPPAYQAPSSAPAYQAPAPSSAPAVAPHPYGHNKGSSQSNALTPTPTTLATYPATTASSNEAGAVTITQIETVYTTAEVTVYNRHRRHEHNHAH